MNFHKIFKNVLILGISLFFCCNAKCQSNVSSCKTYKTPKIVFHPNLLVMRTYSRALHIMSFDYNNNKCLEITYPAFSSFIDIFEHSFKQIGDTLEVDLSDIAGIEETDHFLMKGNRLYRLNIYGEIKKGSKGLKLLNDKAISRLQKKYKNSFKHDHIIIEDSCFRLEKQQK